MGACALPPVAGGNPPPQGVGALAAFERNHRAAISERVRRCRPVSSGNEVRCAVLSLGVNSRTS